MDSVNERHLLKIGANAGIAGIGDVAATALAYLSAILITRFIGPELYGIFLLASILISIGAMFSKIGLSRGLLRFVALYKGQKDDGRIKGVIVSATGISFLLSLLVGAALFISSGFISTRVFDKPQVGLVVRLLAFTLPLVVVGNGWRCGIQGFQIIKYRVYIEKLIQPALRLLLLAILFLVGFRLIGVVLATILTSISGFLLSFHYLAKVFPFHKRQIKATFENRRLIQFSTPLLFQEVLNFLILHIDTLMIAHFLLSSNVGIYGAVVRVSTLVAVVLTAFNSIFAPMISELYGKGDLAAIEALFKTVTKWVLSLALPVFLILVFFAKPVMAIFGPAFSVGAPCLILLCIAQLINAGVGSVGLMLTMTGRPKVNLLNSAILCVLNIILNYVLIPKYGILGAAAATGASIAIINVLRLAEVYHFLGIHPYKLSILKPVAAGAVSILLVALLRVLLHADGVWSSGLLMLGLVGTYIALLTLFGLDEEDALVLAAIGRRLNTISLQTLRRKPLDAT